MSEVDHDQPPGGPVTVNSGLRSYPFEPFTGDLPAELLEMVVAEPVSRVRLPDGRAATFVSCPACEITNWFALDGDGTPLTRGEVTGTG